MAVPCGCVELDLRRARLMAQARAARRELLPFGAVLEASPLRCSAVQLSEDLLDVREPARFPRLAA
jgi:hypothetical protein